MKKTAKNDQGFSNGYRAGHAAATEADGKTDEGRLRFISKLTAANTELHTLLDQAYFQLNGAFESTKNTYQRDWLAKVAVALKKHGKKSRKTR